MVLSDHQRRCKDVNGWLRHTWEAEEVAREIKYLAHKGDDVNLDPIKPHKSWAGVIPTRERSEITMAYMFRKRKGRKHVAQASVNNHRMSV